ncbi:MAG: hypothetical protein HOQ24_06935 [Mycobacteriaceae bacterium]|nr:hypothetical protein [Mycobacteriaceae bacterium]
MGEISSGDYQRIAGWLALRTQTPGGLLYGLRVEYVFGGYEGLYGQSPWAQPAEQPAPLVMSWRGGPTAAVAAENLLDPPDPDTPATLHRDGRGYELTARLDLAGVPVKLCSVAPSASRRVIPPIGATDTWSWPQPLQEIGVATDYVLWRVAPESGGVGEATVIRLPSVYQWEDGGHYWGETGYLVVDRAFQPDEHEPFDHQQLRRRCEQLADVRIRGAGDMSLADADAWLEDQVTVYRPNRDQVEDIQRRLRDLQRAIDTGEPLRESPPPPARRPRRPDSGTSELLPAPMSAVVFPAHCLMRWSKGLRIHATVEGAITGAYSRSLPTSYVPAVVSSALRRVHDPGTPPTALHVRVFGYAEMWRYNLATDLVPPADLL